MSNEIDALDRALKRSGQPVVLRLVVGTSPQVFTDVTCPAIVRGYTPQQLIGGITQQDSLVILSPTQINAADWPGLAQGAGQDVRIPSRNRGDLVMINGAKRAVQAGTGIFIGTTLVRIEIQVR
jgi:hypothetical protein